MNEQRRKLESGVRKYRESGWRVNWRIRRLAGKLAAVGEDLYVEKNVEIMRHPEKVSLGCHVVLKEGARICPTNPESSIRIGDWTTVGYHTFIFAAAGISIGDNCLIAPFCYLVDNNHSVHRDQLIREQLMTASPISIGDDVWLGVGSAVLKGVTIGRGAVIGAGAVIREDVPEYAIVSGNPSQIVGYRE